MKEEIRVRLGEGSGAKGADWRDRGSGTVLMINLVILAGFLIVVILSLAAAIVARHRAGAAADLAALAAVSGSAGSAGSADCAQAQRVARANQGRLVGCRPVGDGSVVVEVESAAGGWALFGTARGTARASPGAYLPVGQAGRAPAASSKSSKSSEGGPNW